MTNREFFLGLSGDRSRRQDDESGAEDTFCMGKFQFVFSIRHEMAVKSKKRERERFFLYFYSLFTKSTITR